MRRVKAYFLFFLAFTVCGVVFSVAPAQAADKPIEVRLAHMFPVGSPSHQIMEAWAKKIATDSNGRLTARIFPVNTLVPAPELVDAVASGTADMSFGFRYAPKGQPLGVTFPFILGAPDVITATKVYDDLWKKFPKVMADEWKDVKILWLTSSMFQALHTRKPVRSLDDMKGLQIRVPSPEMAMMMKDLGATPVFMSTADFVIGMEKKTVDGGTIQPQAVEDNKLAGNLKYMLDLSLGAPTPVFAIMNKDFYGKLPADLKAVIDKSCDWGKQATVQMWVDAWEEVKKYYKTEGVEIVTLPSQERAKVVSIVEKTRDKVGRELDAKGIPGTEVVKYIRERVQQYAK
ncbi:MAG TPA: TRAP transporter substrate-binding protein DctP [Syntrophorhabdaceae bacterium]|nr:TRAP transporter substrate-binding protein DctP [Syntrophorhabdaceae bacterium]